MAVVLTVDSSAMADRTAETGRTSSTAVPAALMFSVVDVGFLDGGLID